MQITNSKDGKLNSVTGERISTTKYGLHVIAEAAGIAWDSIAVTYPTSSSEVYTYSLAADVVRVVTVSYTDASKETLSSVVRV